MKLSIIIPMYNEGRIIVDTAKILSSYMEANFDSYEILFSDDGSTDGGGELVRQLSLPYVKVTGYSENHGKGCAVRHAMLEADGDLVIFTDADLAYGTDVIRNIYEFYCDKSLDTDVHMIIGSRNLGDDGYEGYSPIRKLMSKIYIRVLGLVGGFRLSDSQCGCKAFRGDAAKEIFSRCTVDGFAFDFEAILWADKLSYRILEIPVKVINHRESKVRIVRDTLRMLQDLRRIRKRIQKTPITTNKV